MIQLFARIIDSIAAWLERVLSGTPELVPVPIPVKAPRRRWQ
jgi:hypothetical protein